MSVTRSLQARLDDGECFLTEAAVVERMRREFRISADEHLVYGGAIYDAHSRKVLTGIYRSYIDIARGAGLPILITSSTRRSNQERIAASSHSTRNVNEDWMAFLREVRGDDTDFALAGSLLGTKGDAYRPEEALTEADALAFHRYQCQACLKGDSDFLIAGVLPALSEAKGLARAMSETGKPFIISFIINCGGTLLDGTPLGVAMASIDEVARPLCYMVNCVHPANVRAGLSAEINRDHPSLSRLIGIQANASRLPAEELDNRADLHGDGAESTRQIYAPVAAGPRHAKIFWWLLC